MNQKLFIIILVTALIPSFSHAEIKAVYATHKFAMGDNDSKNDARRMCFLEAKRKVLEKAGTYIENHFKHTVTDNFQITKEELTVYSAALLKVETISERWILEGHNLAVIMTVKADVDTRNFDSQLSRIRRDTSVQRKINDQQTKIKRLEDRVIYLQKLLATTDDSVALPLRKEKLVVFKEIEEIESKYIIALSSMNDRKTKSARRAQNILKYVEIGMTPKEVQYILGESGRRESYSPCYTGILCWNYDDVLIVFNSEQPSAEKRFTQKLFLQCNPGRIATHNR